MFFGRLYKHMLSLCSLPVMQGREHNLVREWIHDQHTPDHLWNPGLIILMNLLRVDNSLQPLYGELSNRTLSYRYRMRNNAAAQKGYTNLSVEYAFPY
jgi:hypothetical protein